MKLFRNATELQKFVTVDSTLTLQSLEPFEEEVKEEYLLDWIGAEQYEDLVTNFDDLTSKQKVLLPFVQRIIANFAVAYYLDVPISIGNSGAARIEGENEKTAYKYQVASAKQRLIESGWNAVERLISFLSQFESDYPLWSSEAKANSRGLIINSYKTFKRAYHVVNGRWVFEGLRPIMADVELFTIMPTIGQTYYDALKAEILANTLTDENKKALFYMQKAIAYLTIEQAIIQKKGTLHNNRFVFISQNADDNTYQMDNAFGSSKKRNAHTMGNRYLAALKTFLIENIANYPDFATHHNAKVEKAAEKPYVAPKDKKIMGFF